MSSKTQLTTHQREVLDFLRMRIRLGIPPTIREICRSFGIRSPNGIMCTLNLMEAKGVIRRRHVGHARSIEIIDDPQVDTIWGSFPIGEDDGCAYGSRNHQANRARSNRDKSARQE